ncbi:hypothetical protein FRC17_009130 [Serendipita sp. 399]|nr:hypothetical protein FRC17_009130 [Serendipita sp. 399]
MSTIPSLEDHSLIFSIATPLDRPFPDENTVSEMYCNEAYTVDTEAVEDWTSSLTTLLTFAAIFSAVLITLIVDSKTLLQQDKTEVLVDAVVFLMNDLANGTHRPYAPPPFHPSTQSIAVNCFFFASLCLSIATALAAVLAMQWVTDYGAVTRRAGSTPEERVKRRHFRYQGGQDWGMDTIISSLPIALHLSVLLFFVGLIIWMWDVHHSVLAVVLVCGVVSAIFYVLTTILAIFCPSCPYRTPLAGGVYKTLHLVVIALSPFASQDNQKPRSGDQSKRDVSTLRQFVTWLHFQFAQPSLTLRDDTYIRNPDKGTMLQPLVWLSNQIPFSPEVYQRVLVLVDELSSFITTEVDTLPFVPWKAIFNVLGTVYQSFVQDLSLDNDEFAKFLRRTHCLNEPAMRRVLESCFSSGSVTFDGTDFPVRLLHAWTESTCYHTTDALRKQRYLDEVVIQELVENISSSPQELLESWYGLLIDEKKTCHDLLPRFLSGLNGGLQEKMQKRLDTVLYLISTGKLPWDSLVSVGYESGGGAKFLPSPTSRRLRTIDWVDSLRKHPQKGVILRELDNFGPNNSLGSITLQNALTREEAQGLQLIFGNITDESLSRWMIPEKILYSALYALDGAYRAAKAEDGSRLDMMAWTATQICADLWWWFAVEYDPGLLEGSQAHTLRNLSNPILRLVSCAIFELEWEDGWSPSMLEAKDSLTDKAWEYVSWACFRLRKSYVCSRVWRLRLRLWTHFHSSATWYYIRNVLYKLDLLERLEQEIRASQLGIDAPTDFVLALFHLSHASGWNDASRHFLPFVPNLLIGDTISLHAPGISQECIDHFSAVCDDLNTDPDPGRLIRLLIELIRADINLGRESRSPLILLNLLKHARSHLCDKDLRPYSPSCRRLSRYIKASCKQYEDEWDQIIGDDRSSANPHPDYEEVDRGALGSVYEEVITLLESAELPRDGERTDISWSRNLLRPTGTKDRPFEEDVEEEANSQQSNLDGLGGDAEHFSLEVGEVVSPEILKRYTRDIEM